MSLVNASFNHLCQLSGFLLKIEFPKGKFIDVCLFQSKNFHSPFPHTMSTSSRPKKVKKKGTITQLKIVETVSKHGYDTIKLEEVKTPWGRSQITTSAHTRNKSSSPMKCQKMEGFDQEPIDFNMDDANLPNMQRTIVRSICLCLTL